MRVGETFYFPSSMNGLSDAVIVFPGGAARFKGIDYLSLAAALRGDEMQPLFDLAQEADDGRTQA